MSVIKSRGRERETADPEDNDFLRRRCVVRSTRALASRLSPRRSRRDPRHSSRGEADALSIRESRLSNHLTPGVRSAVQPKCMFYYYIMSRKMEALMAREAREVKERKREWGLR